jgi:glutamate racemase
MRMYTPIGIFDSGMGGLSVMRDIRTALPHEHLLYVADSGHVPYGNKSQEYIQQRSVAIIRFFITCEAKAVVIACNTATAAAAAHMRSQFTFPIVGMEPAVKPAVAVTRTGVVGVLATVGTLQSARFAALLEHFGQEVKVVTQPAPDLVKQVEAGELTGPTTQALVEQYTQPLLDAGADTIVLGSTHFAHLRSLITQVVGPNITLIDTGAAVARQLHRVLKEQHLLGIDTHLGSEQFWTSGNAQKAQSTISHLWGRSVEVHQLPEYFASEPLSHIPQMG